MFNIYKDRDYVYVEVNIKKRETKNDERILVYWRDCVKHLKEKFPDVDYQSKPEVPYVFSSFKEPHDGVWKFKINKEEKSKKIKSKSTQEKSQHLTKVEESATVEETEQSELPVIVQEPTE